jgi:hypothetical protein
MATFDWNNFPVIPGFDALQMKAEVQAEILRETEGMTDEEVREYFRRGSEELRKEGEQYRAKRAKLPTEPLNLTG